MENFCVSSTTLGSLDIVTLAGRVRSPFARPTFAVYLAVEGGFDSAADVLRLTAAFPDLLAGLRPGRFAVFIVYGCIILMFMLFLLIKFYFY